MPHALRLQGVLVGGVTIIFNKQQKYLLGENLNKQLLLDKSHAYYASEVLPEHQHGDHYMYFHLLCLLCCR